MEIKAQRNRGCRKASLWNIHGLYFMASINEYLMGITRHNFDSYIRRYKLW